MNDDVNARVLIGHELYCQYRDGAYYRAVIRNAWDNGDAGFRLSVVLGHQTLAEGFTESECRMLLEGGMVMRNRGLDGIPDLMAFIFWKGSRP